MRLRQRRCEEANSYYPDRVAQIFVLGLGWMEWMEWMQDGNGWPSMDRSLWDQWVFPPKPSQTMVANGYPLYNDD